jgi:pimeloyl-ACP methyl ester carboxylesterase
MKTFTSTDGLSIAYREWGEPSALPPVVLQHGFITDSLANWERPGVVAALVKAGRHVVAVDARGHGSSAKPHDISYYGEQRMAADLSLLFGVLGVTEVDLAGYSMGGIVALITAATDTRVRRLVTGGIGASAAELGGLDSRVLPGRALIDGLLADDPAQVTDPHALAFRAFADASGGDRPALAAQAQAAHRTPIALDQITAPTLILAGQDDYLATRPQVLAEAIPDARWKIISGDHLSAVANPDFATALTGFLAA